MGDCARLTVSELQRPEQTSQNAPDATGGVSPTSDVVAGPVAQVHEPEQQRTQRKREDIRGALAITFTVFFGVTLAAGFVAAMVGGEAWTNGRDFLQFALPTITGLLGSAVGFYFGSQRQ